MSRDICRNQKFFVKTKIIKLSALEKFMILLKILGGIDLISSFAFLMFVFGIHPFTQFILFCAGLLLIKGMFLLTGDILSIIDIFSSFLLIISIFFTLPAVLLWIPAFLLLAKAVVSFI